MTEYAKLVVAVDSTQAKQTIDVLIRLDDAGRKVDDTNKKMERSSRSLTGALTRLAAPLAAFLSVRAVIRASDEYGQMSSRIRNATTSSEEYALVQERLLETANGTYRALSEAQEVYLSTSDVLRDLGYTTAEVLDITDSFSYALVRDAARADQATASMDAYSKALMKGKIDADAWATIMAATPSIVNGIAEATGRATDEIRTLGATGKLSVEALNEGLRRSREENKRFADAMETSVEDAVINLQNSFSYLIGTVNESTGASSGLVRSLEGLAALLRDPQIVQGLSDITSSLVTLTSWLVQGSVAVYNFFDELTDGLAGIRHLTEVQRMEEEILSLQVELNNLTADLMSPDWLLSIRGLDRGQIEAQAKSLQLMIKGLNSTLQDMKSEEGVAALSADLDSILEKLGGFREEVKPLGLVAAATSEADKAAKKLASSYDSALSSLQRQVALYGQTTEAARILYELEFGSLKGIAGQQAQRLKDLAAELDTKRDLTEQEQRRIDILRESGQLRAANDAQFQLEYAAKITEYEKQGNKEALQRLETLRRIREIKMNAEQAPGTVEGVTQAPTVTGADAMFGGAFGELAKLQEQAVALEQWRAMELEKQKAYLDTLEDFEEEYATRVENIHQQHRDRMAQIDAASQQVALSAASQGFADLASILQSAGDDQSAAYQIMFAASKVFSMAQAGLNLSTALTQVLADPTALTPWQKFANVAAVAAAGANLVGQVADATLSFEGGGSTGFGPRVGGLDGKGGFMAMVHPNETIIDHTKPGKGGMPGIQNVQIINNGEPASARTLLDGDTLKIILDRAEDRMTSSVMKDSRFSKTLKRRYGLRDSTT